MSLKDTLSRVVRPLLPPVIVALARRFRSEWRYAGTSAAHIRSDDWQHSSIIDANLIKWPRWHQITSSSGPLGASFEAPILTTHDIAAHNLALTFGYVIGLAARGKENISILDWGGSTGHYYAFARTLFPDLSFSYTVAELSHAIEAGRSANPDVKFVDATQPLTPERYDLIFVSGSLQYSADWRDILRTLARRANSYLFITRLPIVSGVPSFVAAQRVRRYGYQTEYRGWCLNRHDLLSAASAAGGHLVREFVADDLPHLVGAPEQPTSAGFLFRFDGDQA